MGWNGADLVTELSTLLGDTSTAFKAKTLQYINDTQIDICARCNWNFLKYRGQKVLTAEESEQSLILATPDTPTATITTGGSLDNGSSYYVKVTYYEGVSKVESLPSSSSSVATADASKKTISVTGISLSDDPLVTARRVYLKKGNGDYYLSTTISDNTSTSVSITEDVDSTIEPPEYGYIRDLIGNPTASGQSQLTKKSLDQIRLIYSDSLGTGTPHTYAVIDAERLLLVPAPSTAITLKWYYYKIPTKVYNSTDSLLTIPRYLKEVLVSGVEWRGYRYRDRSGKIETKNIYEQELVQAISKYGKVNRSRNVIRDVVGDSMGYELQ